MSQTERVGVPRSQVERSAVPVSQTERLVVPGSQTNDGFTEVRRPGRKQGPPQSGVAFAAGKSGGKLGRNLREISQKDIGNIDISNRFGELEVDEIIPERREDRIRSGANKKKEYFSLGVHKGKGVQQGRDTRTGVGSEKGKGLVRDGPKDGKAHNNKKMEQNGPKINKLNLIG